MPSATARAAAEGLPQDRSTPVTSISRRSLLGLSAAAVVAPAIAHDAPKAAPVISALLPENASLPEWRGPGLYEVRYFDGPCIVFIEPEPYPLDDQPWFRASECLAHRAGRGSWSMPEASLALMNIRKVGEIGDTPESDARGPART